MSGFGRQPAGRSNAGFGTPFAAPTTLGSMLTDSSTGQIADARLIDPRTGDYVLDPTTGRVCGMSGVRQAVQIAVKTRLGTSAVVEIGNALHTLDRVTANFEHRVLMILTAALQPLVDLGWIEVLGFSTFQSGAKDGLPPGRTYGRLQWRDLTTSQEHQETI